jgi:hypothetical protein
MPDKAKQGDQHSFPKPKLSNFKVPPTVRIHNPWNGLEQTLHDASDRVTGVFIAERTRLHELYIREQARNKRIALILAAILMLASGALITFAPKGREKLSFWVGGALVIFAAGSAGFGRVWAKGAGVSIGASERDRSSQ